MAKGRNVKRRNGPGGGGGSSGGASRKAGVVKDARMRIISKNRSKIGDARDKLVKIAKQGGDARKRLEKIRNLKSGKLDVKTTSKGGITITKTTGGKTLLTTKKKAAVASNDRKRKGPSESVIKSVGRGGSLSLRTRPKNSTLTGVAKSSAKRGGAGPRREGRGQGSAEKITRTIRGEMSEAARLDMELINTKVDPVILKRTVSNGRHEQRRRSSPPRYSRGRSRSPIDVDAYEPLMRPRYNDYDDPRKEIERENAYRSRIQTSRPPPPHAELPTLGSLGGTGISPLEGAKIVVSNLNHSVSREDIIELFGDVGALKRAKISSPGTAEVVFVNRDDAMKAVEIYHNRQLDQKAMICKMVGSGGLDTSSSDNRGGGGLKLPRSRGGDNAMRRSDSNRRGSMPVEINSIHKALFSGGSGRRSDSRTRRY